MFTVTSILFTVTVNDVKLSDNVNTWRGNLYIPTCCMNYKMVNHKPYTKTTLTIINTKKKDRGYIIATLLVFELLIEPIKSFIKTIATSCTSSLDVPITVSERVET